ncbi:hypothetical protein BJ741DRAFT_665933 [Chytriomyces cf. hyalinus JEL632]|nr:hypothetical protein BJ741DRAFT_665933 [Chytriomyces cf. hyalinus JEL632]
MRILKLVCAIVAHTLFLAVFVLANDASDIVFQEADAVESFVNGSSNNSAATAGHVDGTMSGIHAAGLGLFWNGMALILACSAVLTGLIWADLFLSICAFLVLCLTVTTTASASVLPLEQDILYIDAPSSLVAATTITMLWMVDATVVVFKASALISGAVFLFM